MTPFEEWLDAAEAALRLAGWHKYERPHPLAGRWEGPRRWEISFDQAVREIGFPPYGAQGKAQHEDAVNRRSNHGQVRRP